MLLRAMHQCANLLKKEKKGEVEEESIGELVVK